MIRHQTPLGALIPPNCREVAGKTRGLASYWGGVEPQGAAETKRAAVESLSQPVGNGRSLMRSIFGVRHLIKPLVLTESDLCCAPCILVIVSFWCAEFPLGTCEYKHAQIKWRQIYRTSRHSLYESICLAVNGDGILLLTTNNRECRA